MKFILAVAVAAAAPALASAMAPPQDEPVLMTDRVFNRAGPSSSHYDSFTTSGGEGFSTDSTAFAGEGEWTESTESTGAVVDFEESTEEFRIGRTSPEATAGASSSSPSYSDRIVVSDGTPPVTSSYLRVSEPTRGFGRSTDGNGYTCECGSRCRTPNGSEGTCGTNNNCGQFLIAVVCPDDSSTESTGAPSSPSTGEWTSSNDGQCAQCSGPQLRMMNYECDDGSIAGPVCEAPACEWYVRSCPDTTTPSLRSDGAGWCPTVSDMCAERCDFEECDADKECALPATTYSLFDTSTDSPACSCDSYQCAALGSFEASSCGDISCGKLTCQQFMNKGIDPVKDMGCDACDECLECNFWNCAQRDTAIAY